MVFGISLEMKKMLSKNKKRWSLTSSPHVGFDVQQLQGRDPGLTGNVLQDLESRSAVFVKLRADVQQGLPRPPELLPGDALVQLLPRHTLALLQEVEIVPGGKHRTSVS